MASLNIGRLGGVHKGRTIMLRNPEVVEYSDVPGKFARRMPVPVVLSMRDAGSAPTGTRVKCSFVGMTDVGEVPLPLAQATVPVPVPAVTVEFRLEMN